MKERSKAEEAFIDQRVRQLLTKWAEHCIHNDGLPDLNSLPDRRALEAWVAVSQGAAPAGSIHPALREVRDLEMHLEYVEFALAKGWIGKTVKNGRRSLTASGWNTAAAFLKR